MGIIKSIFGPSPEKHEQKGDFFFNDAIWGMAKIEYEEALLDLEKASRRDHESEKRLEEKLCQAKEALALEHHQNGVNLMELQYYDDARELFELAMDLTRDPVLTATLKSRMLEMGRSATAEVPGEIPQENTLPMLDEGRPAPEENDEHFLALCGTLPTELQSIYFSYGEFFKSGYLALNRGEFEQAAVDLARAMEENPSPDSFILLELATAYMNLERLDEARHLLETFIQYHPDALPGYEILCEVLWEMGAYDQVEELLDSCPHELKQSTAFYLLSGETLFQAGDFSGAKSLYQETLKNYGWHEAIARALARTLEAMKDLEGARDIYSQIISQCQSCQSKIDPLIKRKLADLCFALDEHTPVTLELYLSLVQEDPINASYYYNRVSQLYTSLGNEREALRFRFFAEEAER